MIQEALKKVIAGDDLTRDQAYTVMEEIMEGKATPAQIGAFLVAEKLKGETYQEVAGFAHAMLDKATVIETQYENAIDMCGTGGDGAGSFNISTIASFVVAAGGVPVAKHGNRSVSSQCGSADVLEKLGVKIDISAEKIARCLDEIGIGFLFAPGLHRAMKHASAPRRELGVRTVFNILGPIVNPAKVKRQVLGVFDEKLTRLMAKVLRELGSEHVLIVHSEDGLDEVSIYAPTQAVELKDGEITERRLLPEDFGLSAPSQNGISGGTPGDNARIALDVLSGKPGAARDIVVANSACGLFVGGAAKDFVEAATLARQCLDSGAAMEKMNSLQTLTNRI